MEGAFLARNALHNQSRVFINQNCHLYAPSALRRCHNQFRCFLHRFAYLEIQARLLQNPPSFFNIGSFKTKHNRHLDIQLLRRRHHARRQPIHAQNAAKDVDENRLHIRIRKQNLERMLNLLLGRAAAHIQKIRRGCRPRTE